MKRSQANEENCGHWEPEVQHSEDGALEEQSSMPRSLGTATRRLRFLRASSRDSTAGMTLVGMASRVDETFNTLQRAREDVPSALVTTEEGLNRRTSVATCDKPSSSHYRDGSVMGAGHGALDTTEGPVVHVHGEQVPGSTQSVVDELRQTITSDSFQELMSDTDFNDDYCEDDRDKENQDPLGDWLALPRRSPLPEWFPRKPLQDITNILACGLDDEQPQPKKKRNKKMGTTQSPTLLTLRVTPVQNGSTITHPKPFNCATPKQAYNLRKNFR